MFKAIFKTVGTAVLLVFIPLLLLVVGAALTIVGPIAGLLLIIFLPMVIAGIVIGYRQAKKES